MRDKRFIAEHRGGLLTSENHHKLMRWAISCSEHILSLGGNNIDKRLLHALQVAREWKDGRVKTGEAMKASVTAHAAARDSSNPVSEAVARSIGHTVATAHMADHSLGGALYALKAIRLSGKSIDEERRWQTDQLQKLPSEIVELVMNTLTKKEKVLKIS